MIMFFASACPSAHSYCWQKRVFYAPTQQRTISYFISTLKILQGQRESSSLRYSKLQHPTSLTDPLITNYCWAACGSRKYPYPPQGWSLKSGGGQQPKFLKESMKQNWKFQGGEMLTIKNHPWGEVWILLPYFLEPRNHRTTVYWLSKFPGLIVR